VRSPSAIARVLLAPGQLGLVRAYSSGDLEVDDLDAAMRLADRWRPPPLASRARLRLWIAALRACGLIAPPRAPSAELRLRGARHSLRRDRRAIRHHYDLSNEFFALFLDDSMTYSCALFSRGATTLEEAQAAKLELICRKLALQAGQRVLDVGCGWGSFAIHAATHHGVEVLGVTLSERQVELGQRLLAEAGLTSRVDIRLADYRELEGEFDAIASIGMVEHVGEEQIDVYARQLSRLLRPGGRLLNQGIARLRHGAPAAGPFSERYVFPDADPLHLSRVLLALERAGFVTDHVEGYPDDYIDTLDHWARRLDERLEEAAGLVGAERCRVWRLYLSASRHGFETGFSSVFQVGCHLPGTVVESS
jgi:cyclopropane-fatty-acyl-phospholipid synthase